MKIETKLVYMRIVEHLFDPIFEYFVPDTTLTYRYQMDKPKNIDEAAGKWQSIEVLGADGWELVNIVPKNHMYILGVFKRDIDRPLPIQNIINRMEVKEEPKMSISDMSFITVSKPEDIKEEFLTISEIKAPKQIDIPKPPPLRIISEFDGGPFCPQCGSSFKRKWLKRTDKCIQPECPNYWNKK